ncbi:MULTISPECIES: hypothetical protein [unclassified Pseudomonas]|uniref:hypothetical protein n=1 Tax=unclassified Pseudomonas TaxID=196821 RepID=UPI001B322AD8|nr:MULTISPECIES: hypothetical protein [unclassified Pseudomonas]
MAVAVHKLTETDIPECFRGPNVKAVWLVVANGAAYKYCAFEAEAFALAETLQEQQHQQAMEATRLYESPRMG